MTKRQQLFWVEFVWLPPFLGLNDDVPYGRSFSGKNIKDGVIDCSGYVDALNAEVAGEIEKIHGKEVAKSVRVNGAGGAAGIIQAEERKGKGVASANGWQNLDLNRLQAGMVIGESRGGHAKSRYKGIGHIVTIIERNGKKYVSESTSATGKDGKTGVRETELNEYVRNLGKRQFGVHVVDPYKNIRDKLAKPSMAYQAGGAVRRGAETVYEYGKEGVARAADGLAAMFGKAGFNGRAKNKIIRQTFADKGRAQAADRMMHGFGGGRIEGMSADDTAAYAAMVASTESGFNYRSLNQYGYAGAFQMGMAALEDIGLMKKGTAKRYKQSRAAMQNPNNWTVKGGLDAFLGSEAMQHKAFVDYTNKNIAYLRKGGVNDKLIGIGDFGQLAYAMKAAHLKGHGGAKNLLLRGRDSRDANGQSAREYGQHAKESAHLFRTAAAAVRGGTVQVRQPVRAQAALPPSPAPVRAKVPAVPQAVVVKAAAPAPQKTVGYAAAEGGGAVRLAHKPVGQSVSHAKIAWLASGGITSEKG